MYVCLNRIKNVSTIFIAPKTKLRFTDNLNEHPELALSELHSLQPVKPILSQ